MLFNSNSLMRRHQPCAMLFHHSRLWRQNRKSIRWPPWDESHCTVGPWQTYQLSKSHGTCTCLCAGYGYVIWFYCLPNLTVKIVVNPTQKLDWFEDNMPEKVYEPKQIFVQAVSLSSCEYCYSSTWWSWDPWTQTQVLGWSNDGLVYYLSRINWTKSISLRLREIRR